MKRRFIPIAFLFAILTVLPVSATAEEAMSPEALRIANDLNCPVCEGQSVRDSNSQLARDMRRTVQEKLNEGYTEDEVRQYFVDRYGVGILRDPPKSGFFMTLWWAPVIGLAIGALVLGTFVTQKKRSNKNGTKQKAESDKSMFSSKQDDELAEYEERLLKELDDEYNSRDGR